MIRAKYPEPAWLTLSEVRNGTGFRRETRYMDGLAIGTWPSRGMELHGFEIKVSRSDWLTELKKPQKAEAFYERLDYWWLVTSDEDIVHPGELPSTWGWMTVKGNHLSIRQAAAKIEAKPFDRHFLASFVRNFLTVNVPKADVEAMINKEVKERCERNKSSDASDLKWTKSQLSDLQKKVEEFEKASGVRIAHEWNLGKIGEAVALLRHYSPQEILKQYGYLSKSIKTMAQEIDGHIEKAKAALPNFEGEEGHGGEVGRVE
jgi:hypothetical protein